MGRLSESVKGQDSPLPCLSKLLRLGKTLTLGEAAGEGVTLAGV